MAKSTAKTGTKRPTPNKMNIKDLPVKKDSKVSGGALKRDDDWPRSRPCGS